MRENSDIEHAKAFSAKKIVILILLLLVALALLVYGLHGIYSKYKLTNSPKVLEASSSPVTNSTTTPDESPPENIDTYTVDKGLPRSISLPNIGTGGLIQRVGIDQYDAIAVPNNIHIAGWFTDSAMPGDKGVSLIDGHVQGRYSKAIFTNLYKIKVGDKFSVEMGDRTDRQFEVISTRSYTSNEVKDMLLNPVAGIDRQLNLITCTGNFDKAAESFDKRLLVISKRID